MGIANLLYDCPDLDQWRDNLGLYVSGELPNGQPGEAYSGRLQIHNAIGACQVVQVGGDVLPPGHHIYVDNESSEVVVSWPAYSATAVALENAGFEKGDVSGWEVLPRGGVGFAVADGMYKQEGQYGLRWQGSKGLGSEAGVECLAVNKTAVKVYPNQKVSAGAWVMYNPMGHNKGCKGQARLLWYDASGKPVGESHGGLVIGRGNNGRWVHSQVVGYAPDNAATVRLGAWVTSKGAPTWLDKADWDLPSQAGVDEFIKACITLKLRDSAGRTAYWSGCISALDNSIYLTTGLYGVEAPVEGLHFPHPTIISGALREQPKYDIPADALTFSASITGGSIREIVKYYNLPEPEALTFSASITGGSIREIVKYYNLPEPDALTFSASITAGSLKEIVIRYNKYEPEALIFSASIISGELK